MYLCHIWVWSMKWAISQLNNLMSKLGMQNISNTIAWPSGYMSHKFTLVLVSEMSTPCKLTGLCVSIYTHAMGKAWTRDWLMQLYGSWFPIYSCLVFIPVVVDNCQINTAQQTGPVYSRGCTPLVPYLCCRLLHSLNLMNVGLSVQGVRHDLHMAGVVTKYRLM